MFLTRSPELKITITQAQDEAREHEHHAIGPDHLVVAMLTNVRGSTYRVLTEHGLDYETARGRLVAFHDDQPDAESDEADLARDRDALASIGVDLEAVRDAVQSRFGVDIADNWGERRPRRERGRGRGPHGGRGSHGRGHGPHGRGHGMHGGGRRGPQSRRGRRPRFNRVVEEAMDQLRDELRERLEAGRREGAPAVVEQLPLIVLAALLRTEDPALDAVLANTDRAALLREVESQISVAA